MSAPDAGRAVVVIEPDTMVLTVAFKPGKLTLKKALAVQKKWLELMNAIANDISPGVGDIYKPVDFHWLDDGDDTLTLRIGPAKTDTTE